VAAAAAPAGCWGPNAGGRTGGEGGGRQPLVFTAQHRRGPGQRQSYCRPAYATAKPGVCTPPPPGSTRGRCTGQRRASCRWQPRKHFVATPGATAATSSAPAATSSRQPNSQIATSRHRHRQRCLGCLGDLLLGGRRAERARPCSGILLGRPGGRAERARPEDKKVWLTLVPHESKLPWFRTRVARELAGCGRPLASGAMMRSRYSVEGRQRTAAPLAATHRSPRWWPSCPRSPRQQPAKRVQEEGRLGHTRWTLRGSEPGFGFSSKFWVEQLPP
jgi:hypothetical protein